MHPAAANINSLYERTADAWDRIRSASDCAMEQAWLDRFLALVPAAGSILDLGCGGGSPIARYMIGQGRRVTGVDSSPAMIALCRQRFPHQEWCVADMRTLDLGRFDGLLAWDSFFHLCPEEQRRMFPLFGAHTAPRAPLMFTSGPSAGEAIGSWQGESLYHASLDPAEYRTLLTQHGFDVVAFAPEDRDCGRHTVWLAQATS